jgi:phenylpropionate dioxygenase-like ring-hydroxylating dioxygenase large terminal subunit
MTSLSENETLTHVGPETDMGKFMRRFWLPAARSSELVADAAPTRLMLLGEPLIAFRDSAGRIGVMDHRCPHRRASLFFGRNEENGLRCIYHGWKFDVAGNCLDMPNVPPHQDFKNRVKAAAYKALERNGLVWVYMGNAAEAPPLPNIEPTLFPEAEMDITFVQRECNWLQSVEGEIDTSHLSFLHFGKVERQTFQSGHITQFAIANRAPEFTVVDTAYGSMYGAHRPADNGQTYWRVGQFLFPFWTMSPVSDIDNNILARTSVPMDDTHTMWINFTKKTVRFPTDRANVTRRVEDADFVPDYLPTGTDWFGRWRLKSNSSNDYMIDREAQRSRSYSGIQGVNLQDQAITESMGPISDRWHEHLAPSDMAISRVRRLLLRAVEEFKERGGLPECATDPARFLEARGGQLMCAPDGDWVAAYRAAVAKSQAASLHAAE